MTKWILVQMSQINIKIIPDLKSGGNYISFLARRRDEDLAVNFELINGRLMVQSKYFCFVPPRERKHWENHRLPQDIETTEDNYL